MACAGPALAESQPHTQLYSFLFKRKEEFKLMIKRNSFDVHRHIKLFFKQTFTSPKSNETIHLPASDWTETELNWTGQQQNNKI